jgi:hypothetical protein
MLEHIHVPVPTELTPGLRSAPKLSLQLRGNARDGHWMLPARLLNPVVSPRIISETQSEGSTPLHPGSTPVASDCSAGAIQIDWHTCHERSCGTMLPLPKICTKLSGASSWIQVPVTNCPSGSGTLSLIWMVKVQLSDLEPG